MSYVILSACSKWHKGKWQLERDVTQIAHIWRTAILPWIKDVLKSFVPVWEQREKIPAKIHITLYYCQKDTLSLDNLNPIWNLFVFYLVFYCLLKITGLKATAGKNKNMVMITQRDCTTLMFLLLPHGLIHNPWLWKVPSRSPTGSESQRHQGRFHK